MSMHFSLVSLTKIARGGQLLKYFQNILYILCAAISISIFVLTNITTEPLNTGGGNGNPGLLFILILYPFLLSFVYWTVLLLYKWMKIHLNTNNITILTIFSSLLALFILFSTIIKAINFREEIVRVSPSYNNVNEVSLLNTFSNSIFFNYYTFLMLLLLCLTIAGFSVLISLQKKKSKEPNF